MITVFIGTYNRLETLQRTIDSYKRMKTPHELVIVDNGTDHPKCVALLDRLERHVKKIYRLPGCVSMEEATDNFNVAIRDQYERSDSEWFAVSEADVCFDGTHPKAFDAYIRVAEKTGQSVGPHLRVNKDIPACYPLRSRVLACETWMLYKDDHTEFDSLDGIYYESIQIDTTFHLFPRTRFFNRLRMDPIRVGPPYDAMHLDWYLNIEKPNRENGIYIPDPRPMGSWGKQWLRDYWLWFQRDAEYALNMLLGEPMHMTDLCNNSFMLSWAFQYGQGCDVDIPASKLWLHRAIPKHYLRYWDNQMDWEKMIYADDFTALGWAND